MSRFLNQAILCLLILSGCGSSDSEYSGQTEVRLRQYQVQGKKLYQTYCANCHQQNGDGLARLYPPLDGSDYLMKDLQRAACIIKNGQTGPIEVNGVSFNQMMPANEQLTPLEIAEILTYITTSWGNDGGLTSSREVSAWIKQCESGN